MTRPIEWGPVRTFTHFGEVREISMPEWSDARVAEEVAYLSRDPGGHDMEQVPFAARDRIACLSEEKTKMAEALEFLLGQLHLREGCTDERRISELRERYSE